MDSVSSKYYDWIWHWYSNPACDIFFILVEWPFNWRLFSYLKKPKNSFSFTKITPFSIDNHNKNSSSWISQITRMNQLENICILLPSPIFCRDTLDFCKKSCSNCPDEISDSHIRVSKLNGQSNMGSISIWIAFQTSEKIVSGSNEHDQLWHENHFGWYQ